MRDVKLLTSIALIILSGIIVSALCKKLNMPSLVGLIFVGILLGPSALDLFDPTLMTISADIRQFVLIIILTRAGLSLNLKDLKKWDVPPFC